MYLSSQALKRGACAQHCGAFHPPTWLATDAGTLLKVLQVVLTVYHASCFLHCAADPKVSNSRNSRPEDSIALVAARQGRQGGGGAAAAKQTAEAAQRDAIEEARLAVEQIVIPRWENTASRAQRPGCAPGERTWPAF